MATTDRGHEADILGAALGTITSRLAEAAAVTETSHEPDPDLLAALVDAGALRLINPPTYGGPPDGLDDFCHVVRELARHCTSTAWVVSMSGLAHWHLGIMPAAAQRLVWGENVDTWLAASLAPTGQVTVEDETHRLTGRWRNVAGAHQADWFLLAGLVTDDSGLPLDHVYTVVPRHAVRTEPTPATLGLRGIGACDVVVQDEELSSSQFVSVRAVRDSREGDRSGLAPSHRYPFAFVYELAAVMPMIGAAEGLSTEVSAHVRHDVESSPVRRELHLSMHSAATVLAEAAGRIDVAALTIAEGVARHRRLVETGTPADRRLWLVTQRNHALAVRLLLDAAESLYELHGASILQSGSPAQRFWRDLRAAGGHRANDVRHAMAYYGHFELGLDEDDGVHLL